MANTMAKAIDDGDDDATADDAHYLIISAAGSALSDINPVVA